MTNYLNRLNFLKNNNNNKILLNSVINRYYSCSTIKNNKNEEPIKNSIIEKLTNKFLPEHLEVLNESHMHSVPRGSETHFKVIIVSKEFDNKTMISQHRLVNETLKEEFKSGVHALSIHSMTPSKWQLDQSIIKSPGCMGGSKKEKERKESK